MKKAFAGMMLATAILLPSISFAQSTESTTTPVYSAEVQAQITLLQQMISILLEIQKLQQQLLDHVTTPVATGGSVDNTVVGGLSIVRVEYEPKNSDGSFGDVYVVSNEALNTGRFTVDSSNSYTVSFSKDFDSSNCWEKSMCEAHVYRLVVPGIAVGKHTLTVYSESGETSSKDFTVGMLGNL